MKPLLLLILLVAVFGGGYAFAQCPLTATTSAGTICLQGPQGVPGPQGPAGPQGPPGPAGSAAPTSSLPISLDASGNVVIKANVVITGTVSTGSGAATPTVITITRTDGSTCRVTFSPTNSMIWTCP